MEEKDSSWCQSRFSFLERRDFDVYLKKQLTRLVLFIRHPVESRRVLTRVAYLSSTRSDEGRTN